MRIEYPASCGRAQLIALLWRGGGLILGGKEEEDIAIGYCQVIHDLAVVQLVASGNVTVKG
jgi:hypothetical protein